MELAERKLAGNRDLPIMSITMKEGLIDQDQKFKKRIASLDTSTYKVVDRGNLVVGFPIDEGVLGFQNKYEAAAVSPAYDIWKLRDEIKVDRNYFERILRSDTARTIYAANMRGTTNRRRTIPKDTFKKLKFPLPPLEVQKKIASILDKADALRQKTKALIAKYDELAQSLFLEMFGDPFSNEGYYEKVVFKDLTRRITYGFTKPMAHLSEGIHILTAKNIQNGYINYENVHFADLNEFHALTDKSKPEQNDILITKDGSIGRTALYDGRFPVCINQSVALVKPDFSKVNPIYLVRYLISSMVQNRIQKMGKGGGIKHLQITELAKFPTILPPLEIQHQFSNRIRDIEQQKSQLVRSEIECNYLFNGLLQKAFNGKLNL